MKSLRPVTAALATCLFASGLFAAAPVKAAEFSTSQTTEIQTIVKNYLMEHPEVIRDAVAALEEKEKLAEEESRKKALADVGAAVYTAPDGFVIGNPEGKVTLVEFFDYNCGYCKHALGDLDRLMKDNKDLRVILRDFPILSPNSVEASIIAGAAHEQLTGDKFWEFHRKLLAMRAVGKEQALEVAKGLGVDMTKLDQDATKPDIRKGIVGSENLAKTLSINGTPSYVLGDQVVVGAVGYDELNKRIGNIRKCGKALCS